MTRRTHRPSRRTTLLALQTIGGRAALLVALPMAACGEPAAPTVASTATTTTPPVPRSASVRARVESDPGDGRSGDSLAVAAVRGAWETILAHLPPNLNSWGLAMDAILQREPPPFTFSTLPCREKGADLRRIARLELLTLSGAPERLDTDGDCRIVYVAGGMKLEAEFILAGAGGEVLFAWRVPEG
ncbi:MAG: hypothetical protein U0414_33540 [Polyangiaceae bacterium]